MIFLILFKVMFSFVFAVVPSHWSYIDAIHEKHEFYKNDEVIVKPKESWQTLFSLVYIDREFYSAKDCIYYKVPGQELGIIKIKTISSSDKCDQSLLVSGDREITGIKSLKYSGNEESIILDFTTNDLKSQTWNIVINKNNRRPEKAMGLSSAEFRGAKVIFLAPKTNLIKNENNQFLKNDSICHDINEDCEVLGASICDRCEYGWYEIPNGCSVGPKFCGKLTCGGKNQPACRRGMTWQRSNVDFDCRVNSSFAYCSQGLSIQCEGKKAFCR
jgi:hypothetical protein